MLLQLRPTLGKPTGCSPPRSSVQGVLQARILDWAAIPFFRGPSHPKDQAPLCLPRWQVCSLPLASPGKPLSLQLSYKISMTSVFQLSQHC